MNKILLLSIILVTITFTSAQQLHNVNQLYTTLANDSTINSYVSDAKPQAIRYDFFIRDTTVNFTGEKAKAIAINGSIPGPTLYFTEGDTAEIYVHNEMKTETSIHWHGLIIPNQFDGVPYLTTPPIKPGKTYLYKFPLVQSGTYWYHSHSGLQEQSGLNGALIIYKRQEPPMKEYTLLLNDWTNENPYEIERSLHMATDWYSIQKGSVQSYGEALTQGYFMTKLTNEWKRMLSMDVSDVYYNAFHINGKVQQTLSDLRPGDKIKLRIINGSSSTYFWLQFAGGKITVVASDGSDVVPVDVDKMIVGIAETYDIIVTIPDNKCYEFRATSEDRTHHTSLWLGTGEKVSAPTLPTLEYFEGMKMMNDMMNMDGTMNNMGMQMSLQKMDMNTVMYPENLDTISTLNYTMLKAPFKTTLPNGPTKVLHFNLTGNMNRYVWSINNKTLSESDKILIKKGENIKIILYNGTMMRHPMHLHGHFFRVLNGHGDYDPLKNVLDIMPMETDTIEFAARYYGDWFFHCHILYHMMSGMGRVFSYENSPPNPEIPDPKSALEHFYSDDRMFHPMARAGLESNGSDGEIMLANTRYQFQVEWHLGINDMMGYETESHFGRYLDQMQWLFPYIGWDIRYKKASSQVKNLFGQSSNLDNKKVFCAGVQYTLPLLIIADTRLDSEGKLRIQLMREDIPITARLRLNFMVNSDKESMAGLRYIITKYFGISTHYDSDMGFGAGITLNY